MIRGRGTVQWADGHPEEGRLISARRSVSAVGLGGLLILLLIRMFSGSPDPSTPPPAPEPVRQEVPVAPPPQELEPAEPARAPEVAPPRTPALAVLIVIGKGKPLPSSLRVRRGTKEEVVSAKLDPEGRRRIEFPGLVAGTELQVAASGFVPATVVLAGDPPTATAVLEAHARLVVADSAKTGQTLEIRLLGATEPEAQTFTAPGQVEFPELTAGTHEFEVGSKEQLPLGRFEVALEWGERRRIDLEEQGIGVVVEGKTVDLEGRTVREADVIVRSNGLPEGAEFAVVEVKSDLLGRFKVRLRPEIKYSFRGEKPGYGPRDTPVVLVNVATPGVTVVLSSDSTLRGRVVDEEGIPLPGIKVEVSRKPEKPGTWIDNHHNRVTDEEGRFEFDDLPAGWLVEIRIDARGRSKPKFEPVRIEPGVPEQVIVLPAEHRFEARVVHAETGEPVSDPKFHTIRAGGCLPVFIPDVLIRAGRRTEGGKIRLVPAASLRVAVRHADGQPVVDWRIAALLPGKTINSGGFTNAEGRSRVGTTLRPGEWLVLGYPRHTRRPVFLLGRVVIVGASAYVVEATVTDPAVLTVAVRDDRGRAMKGVAVEVLAAAEPPLDLLLVRGLRAWDGWNEGRDFPGRVWAERELVTDGAGRVEVGPLSPGSYRVRVGKREVTTTLTAGERSVLVID